MSDRRIELTVSDEDAGERLDRFLAVPLGSLQQTTFEAGLMRLRAPGQATPRRVAIARPFLSCCGSPAAATPKVWLSNSRNKPRSSVTGRRI